MDLQPAADPYNVVYVTLTAEIRCTTAVQVQVFTKTVINLVEVCERQASLKAALVDWLLALPLNMLVMLIV